MAADQYLIEIRPHLSALRRDMETVRRAVRHPSNQMSPAMEQSGRAIRQSFSRAAAGMRTSITNARAAVNRQIGEIGSQINRATVAAASLGAAFVAIQGARALADTTVQALGAAEAIQDVADAANVSAEFLQGLRGVTQQSGAEARHFDDAIVRLNRPLGLFSQHLATCEGEAGPAANTLRALSLESPRAAGRHEHTQKALHAPV